MCVGGWVCTVLSVLGSHVIFDPPLASESVYSLGLASSPRSPPPLMCVEKIGSQGTDREGGREGERGREGEDREGGREGEGERGCHGVRMVVLLCIHASSHKSSIIDLVAINLPYSLILSVPAQIPEHNSTPPPLHIHTDTHPHPHTHTHTHMYTRAR